MGVGGSSELHLRGTEGRQKDNIEMIILKIAWEEVAWTVLAQDRDKWWGFVKAVTNQQVQ